MTASIDKKILACAELAYEANRQYCILVEDPVPQSWSAISNEGQESFIKGVKLAF